MRILALEPYYGGSHRAFLDGWSSHSRHNWSLLTLPDRKWKWRMRHAAVDMSRAVAERLAGGERWDAVLCTDMLNLAEFAGLCPPAVHGLPRLAYFHENQLTYPKRREDERDYHFVFTNMLTAMAADRVWFNSAYHLDSFLGELLSFLRRMPDRAPLDAVESIRGKASVRYPCIDRVAHRAPQRPGPVRLLWCARWEFDKNPGLFFRALDQVAARGVDFRLSIVGGRVTNEMADVFEGARMRFGDRIDHWGYLETRAEYLGALQGADVVVSSSDHEFFGISVVEAVAAGAFPLVPSRLAYPEVLGGGDVPGKRSFFYDGSEAELAARIEELARAVDDGSLWEDDAQRGQRAVERFTWARCVPDWDDELAAWSGAVDGP